MLKDTFGDGIKAHFELHMECSNLTIYNSIGKDYSSTRKSDSRIVKTMLDILNRSEISTIADIGAGTGSYAYALASYGYNIIAIEPSQTMCNQAIFHSKIKWIDAYAESLPLSDRYVNAAIIMLAMHHFDNYQQALKEAYRVTGGGSIIIFTYDPNLIRKFWLTDYFPAFITDVQANFIPIYRLVSDLEKITNQTINVDPFLLPNDLTDSFAAVGWSKPELYLDSKIRQGISAFHKIEYREINKGLSCLQKDLKSGRWDKKYNYLRYQNSYDAGYRFVYSQN
jgi:ubiquinone/menaquinone biosynthesis C-methylase UbiE